MRRKKYGILQYFWTHYRWQSMALLAIQFATGLLEGLGIAALLPLIDALINEGGGGDTPLHHFIAQVFAFLNLSQTLENTLILITILFTAKAILRYYGMLYVAHLSSRTIMDFRKELVQALLKTQWSFYITRPTGIFVNALMLESQRAGSTLRCLADIFSALLQMFILIFIAGLASWKAIAIGMLASGFLWIALYRFIVETGKAGLEQKDTSKRISADITDILQNYKPLKAMNIEETVFVKIQAYIEQLANISRRQIMAKQSMNIFHEPLFIALVCVGLYGAIVFLKMPTAILMVFTAIFYRFIIAWKGLQQGYQVLTGQESFFWSFQDFVHEAKMTAEPYTEGVIPHLSQQIQFQNVSFSYQDKSVLKDFNISFPAHHFIGICGSSGKGKTTIIDLICGLHKPEKGDIFLDENNLNDVDLYEWRQKIGYVPQEFVIFDENIRFNIALGDTNISDEQIIDTLKKVEAWSFVKELPDGLDTQLGVAGGQLSGGQRQRISLARALIRKPSLLIIDEATAALDPETELEILKTLKSLTKNVTIIAISHQKAIKQQADLLIDLDKLDA